MSSGFRWDFIVLRFIMCEHTMPRVKLWPKNNFSAVPKNFPSVRFTTTHTDSSETPVYKCKLHCTHCVLHTTPYPWSTLGTAHSEGGHTGGREDNKPQWGRVHVSVGCALLSIVFSKDTGGFVSLGHSTPWKMASVKEFRSLWIILALVCFYWWYL